MSKGSVFRNCMCLQSFDILPNDFLTILEISENLNSEYEFMSGGIQNPGHANKGGTYLPVLATESQAVAPKTFINGDLTEFSVPGCKFQSS
jgi:hypothetical protein